jgi:hypothetical protein
MKTHFIILKKIFFLILLTIIFSLLIFFVKNVFLWWEKYRYEHIETNYMEPEIKEDHKEEKTKEETKIILNAPEKISKKEDIEEIKEKIKIETIKKKIIFSYFPKSFEKNVFEYKNILLNFLENKFFNPKIKELKIGMYKNIIDSRGKMKNKTLKFFWVLKMEQNEFLAVGIHEFAHYIDLYFLEKLVFKDISDYFYNISWESTKVMKKWNKGEDFVSWYAMTNKYEDFAESLTYYILHNLDFYEKWKKSKILKKKYDFFTRNLFREWNFIWTDFSPSQKIKNYYRDTTKINFNLKKFLLFLKK